jgi:hypothetical protein
MNRVRSVWCTSRFEAWIRIQIVQSTKALAFLYLSDLCITEISRSDMI